MEHYVGHAILLVMVLGLGYVVIGDVLAKRKGGAAAILGPTIAQHVTDALAGSPTTRTAGQVVDSMIEDIAWLKANTDADDSVVKPVETLLPHLLHQKAPIAGGKAV